MKKGPLGTIGTSKLAGAFGLLLAVALIVSLAAPAMALQWAPHKFQGLVVINGLLDTGGTQIEARIDGVVFTTGVSDGTGKYGAGVTPFYVQADDPDTPGVKEGGVNGDTVEFWVEVEVESVDVWFLGGSSEFITSELGPPLTTTMDLVVITVFYDLTTSSTAGGSVTVPGEGVFPDYPAGTVVALLATPDGGFMFVKWTGGNDTVADTNAANTTITMNADYAVVANFAVDTGPTPTPSPTPTTPTPTPTPATPTPTPTPATPTPTPTTGPVTPTPTTTTGPPYIPPPPTPVIATPTPTPTPTPGPETPTPTPTEEPPTPTPTPTEPPPTPIIEDKVDLSGSIGGDGVTTDDVQQSLFVGVLDVSIASGTTALTEGGDPLQGITVKEVVAGFPKPECVIGSAYDLGPEGSTFSPPFTLTLSYDLGFEAGTVDEQDLAIAYQDGTGWVALPSTVDADNDTVTAEVDHLSYFAVFNTAGAGCAPEVTPTPTEAPATPTPTATPEEDGGGIGVGAIIGIIIAVIAVILIIYFIMRRRSQAGA